MFVLLVLAVVVIVLIANMAAASSGPDVAKRFLEVTPDYTADGLRNWTSNDPAQAHRYVYPVLFPLDLLFLAALAGLFAIASIATAQALHWDPDWIWILAIFPVLYAGCDFIENVVLARLLLSPAGVTDRSAAVAQTLTGLKFRAAAISALQLVFVAPLGVLANSGARAALTGSIGGPRRCGRFWFVSDKCFGAHRACFGFAASQPSAQSAADCSSATSRRRATCLLTWVWNGGSGSDFLCSSSYGRGSCIGPPATR